MKKFTLLMALSLIFFVMALSQSITRSSINSLGTSVTQDKTLIRQSVGQAAVVGTVENGIFLRQGFQQPISRGLYLVSISNLQMEVYPNPAVDEFTYHLTGIKGEYQYRLQDILGKTVVAGKSNEEKQIIRSNQLRPGIYLFTIYQEQEILGAKKIIISKN